ncbi:MAG: S-methyl-5-thioribose-1-phosphate isomerase [Synergistaceae bacterium]|nr:S-methyl-5-thioribose-1-phosphate isomerase [Synergistaceae bacterium]
MLPATMEWKDGALWLLDQRALPCETKYIECRSAEDVALAIENMTVRGAPAIGAAAAYGLALAARAGDFQSAAARLAATRPTAVNLFWAIERMKRRWQADKDNDDVISLLEKEAVLIHEEDIKINREIGRNGALLLPERCAVITHCNAGALATAGYGTALGVFRAAAEAGKKIKIYADETRPRMQGGSLTAYELMSDGFDVTVITDSTAAFLMAREKIDAVVTGADRVAMNGDAANKIGTYSLAIAAARHGVPFYIAAPLSTFDTGCASGADIPIEERDGDELRMIGKVRLMPAGVKVWNPSFDVTPAELIAGIITERGVIRPPYAENTAKIFSGKEDHK